jgi:hypothetical protein
VSSLSCQSESDGIIGFRVRRSISNYCYFFSSSRDKVRECLENTSGFWLDCFDPSDRILRLHTLVAGNSAGGLAALFQILVAKEQNRWLFGLSRASDCSHRAAVLPRRSTLSVG